LKQNRLPQTDNLLWSSSVSTRVFGQIHVKGSLTLAPALMRLPGRNPLENRINAEARHSMLLTCMPQIAAA
jgi:hypothetical protein